MTRDFMETGVPWFPRIPASWNVTKIKRIGKLEAGAGFPHSEQGRDNEELPFFKVGDMAKEGNERYLTTSSNTVSRDTARKLGAQVLPPGTVVFAKVGAALLLNRRRMLAVEGCVDNNVMAFIPACDPNWAYYWLSTLDFARLANPGAVPSINEGQVGELEAPLPPTEDQQAIASFLDRQTARIDTLIDKKRRLLDLLEEKRESKIAGLVDGRREYPLVKLGHLIDVQSGFAFPSSGFTRSEGDVRLLRGTNVGVGHIDWTETVRWPREDAARYFRWRLAEGDIVFGMDRPWISGGIRVARIGISDLPALLLQRVARIRATHRITPDYLQLVLGSPQFRGYFEPILTGVSVPHISPSQISGFRLPLPPLEHQREAVAALTQQETEAQRVRSALHRSISLLQEHRTALISAAVTGRIDVTEPALAPA